MLFMMGSTIYALVLQIGAAKDTVMQVVAIVLLALAAWITFEAVVSVCSRRAPASQSRS
jgi:hypothetical protein